MNKYKILAFKLPEDYKENPYTVIWDYDCFPDYVEAEDPEEAEDFAKDYIREGGEDPENYLFKICTVIVNELGVEELEEV